MAPSIQRQQEKLKHFLRPLWGFGPYLVDEDDAELASDYLKGIIAGTDPQSDEYWGTVTDYDQLIVEMASISTTLLLNPEKSGDV